MNYISVNGTKIELTEEQVNQIIAAKALENPTIQLSEVAVGDTFKIGEHEFIVLEQTGETTAVIRKELLPDSRFGNTNNYFGSDLEHKCSMFANEIESIVGDGIIVKHMVDLTSNDGLKDYGTKDVRVSPITADQYRSYVDILEKFKPDNWWWLATPFSTKKHNNNSCVLCVSPSGCIGNYRYIGIEYGVRPFCILKSDIFVSR